MTLALIRQDTDILNQKDGKSFYRELTSRNKHFISTETQEGLKNLKVLVAGCGAGGGACIEPLARIGVTQFRLADNGNYEISNLNRQHTFVDHVGMNKAEFHAKEVKRINPFVDVEYFPSGMTEQNLPELTAWADIVIDAVDVTNPVSIQIKFLLHKVSHELKKPVISPLDPGWCQMGQTYDYRNPKVAPMAGRLEACRSAKHPIKALFTMFPIERVPGHTLKLVEDLLKDQKMPASQLGASADILSGVIAAAIVRYASTGELIKGWYYDLGELALNPKERFFQWIDSFRQLRTIRALIKELE